MISDLDLKIDLVIANELDLLGQVILFFANELDLFIKIKEMVILNNLGYVPPFLGKLSFSSTLFQMKSCRRNTSS